MKGMRRFALGIVFTFALFTSAAVPAYAANLPLLDPNFSIVPTECRACPCDYGGVLQLIQNLMNAAVSIGVIAFVLVAAYAGASFMLNPTSPEARNQAKSMLLNVVIGMVIVLGAWLFVDFIMKTLYNPNSTSQGVTFGPWNKILVSDDPSLCIQHHDQGVIGGLLGGIATGFIGGNGGGGAYPLNVINTGAGNCSPTAISTAAATGGYRLSAQQANTLSCIAVPESSCGRNTNIPKTTSGQQTSARGMFQITLGANDQCHSLNFPVCTQAAQRAGWTGSGSLQCSNAFSGGRPKPGMEALANACTAAALDLNCNATAAACLLQKNTNYSDWTADSRANAQAACVAKYSI